MKLSVVVMRDDTTSAGGVLSKDVDLGGITMKDLQEATDKMARELAAKTKAARKNED